MNNSDDYKTKLSAFDAALNESASPPARWKTAGAAPRGLKVTDLLLRHTLSGSIPLTLVMMATVLAIDHWTYALLGFVVIPPLLFLLSPWLTVSTLRTPWRFLLVCAVAGALTTVAMVLWKWNIAQTVYDPVWFFSELQEAANQVSRAHTGGAILGGALLFSSLLPWLAARKPWIGFGTGATGRWRTTLLGLWGAFGLWLLLVTMLILWVWPRPEWLGKHEGTVEWNYLIDRELPADIQKGWSSKLDLPHDPKQLVEYVRRNSVENNSILAGELSEIITGKNEALAVKVLPLCALLLEAGSGGDGIQTMNFTRLALNYSRFVTCRGLVWAYLGRSLTATVVPVLATQPLQLEQLKELRALFPHEFKAEAEQMALYQDHETARDILKGPRKGLSYPKKAFDLGEAWLELERRIASWRMARLRAEGANYDEVAQPLWGEYVLPWLYSEESEKRIKYMLPSAPPQQNLYDFDLPRAVLEARIWKATHGQYPRQEQLEAVLITQGAEMPLRLDYNLSGERLELKSWSYGKDESWLLP